MDASLVVLNNLPPEEADRQVWAVRGRAVTPWRTIRNRGARNDDVFRYARNESGLLFVASSAGDEKALGFRISSGPGGLRPGISWVVVEPRGIRQGSNPVKPSR